MAKKTAAWILMGLPEQPPVDAHGYVNYGTVWSADQPSQRESLRHCWEVATWSWHYWGKKVRRDIENVRAEGGRETLAARALDHIALAFVGLANLLHRPKG